MAIPGQQTEEQRLATFQAAGTQPVATSPAPTPQSSTLSATNIGTPQLKFPPTQEDVPPAFPQPSIDEQAASFAEASAPAQTGAEGFQSDLQTRFAKLSTKLFGEAGAQAEAEKEQGIQQKTQAVADIQAQINQLQNESQSAQITASQSGETQRFASGQVARIQRQTAIQALTLNSFLYAAQGNLAVAQDMADKAVAAEFDPIQKEIDFVREFMQINESNLAREDKKRAERLNLQLNERQRLLDEQMSTKTDIQNIGMLAAQYGADAKTLKAIQESDKPADAMIAAGRYLQDPVAKIQLQNAMLDTQIKQAKIKEDTYRLDLLKQYGGLTPEQFNAQLKKEREEIGAQKTATDKAKAQARVLNQKSLLIDSIVGSKSLDSVVGATPFTRGFGRASGVIPKTVSFTSAFGIWDEFLGADDVVGLTEQLVSKEFLQSLIDVKAQGATFGALQKAEQDALTNAAIAIGNARIYSGKGEEKKVIGYDMSEKEFKNQMGIIKANADLAYNRATGESFTPEEQEFFNSLEEIENETNFDPSS